MTKTSIENYQDLEGFQKKHGDFIGWVQECFQDISNHYKVDLPVSEIAYIYDYIHLNSKNKMTGRPAFNQDREDE